MGPTVFFDLDDTLTDPNERITHSSIHALVDAGIHEALNKLKKIGRDVVCRDAYATCVRPENHRSL